MEIEIQDCTGEIFMKNNKGFTLIELVFAIAISAVLGVMITTVFISNNKHVMSTAIDLDRQNSARQALDLITSEIRRNDIVGKIVVDDDDKRIRINGNRKNYYTEYYFEDGHMMKLNRRGKLRDVQSKFKLSGFNIDEEKPGEYLLTVKYLNSKNELQKIERTVVSRTANRDKDN